MKENTLSWRRLRGGREKRKSESKKKKKKPWKLEVKRDSVCCCYEVLEEDAPLFFGFIFFREPKAGRESLFCR
jgi:hypothetical protein